MLAARARGLGTCWTTMHMPREREVADLLGIPYDSVQQVCLTPLAYTLGTDFKPAQREDPETYIHWDRWDVSKPVPPPWGGFANSNRANGREDEMTEAQEILNVMSRYCRAVDDREFDRLLELLAEDVRFGMGDVTESRAELLEYIQANLWPAGRHTDANPVVTVDGDAAHVDTDWVWLTPTSCRLGPAVTPTTCDASTGAGVHRATDFHRLRSRGVQFGRPVRH